MYRHMEKHNYESAAEAIQAVRDKWVSARLGRQRARVGQLFDTQAKAQSTVRSGWQGLVGGHVGGKHGPLDQMEAAGFTAAFDLIRVHHSVKRKVRGECGGFSHAYASVRLT